MTVSEAIQFFAQIGESEKLGDKLDVWMIGLGYLRLGQPLNTLSGGESAAEAGPALAEIGGRAEAEAFISTSRQPDSTSAMSRS